MHLNTPGSEACSQLTSKIAPPFFAFSPAVRNNSTLGAAIYAGPVQLEGLVVGTGDRTTNIPSSSVCMYIYIYIYIHTIAGRLFSQKLIVESLESRPEPIIPE